MNDRQGCMGRLESSEYSKIRDSTGLAEEAWCGGFGGKHSLLDGS